jgi:ferrous-iron efflux pump FieF
VARQAIVQLMDQELPDDARARIRQIALAHPQVRSVHDLRTRAAGPDAFVQIHLEMDGDLTLKEAHRVSDAVEADILAAFPQAEVMIHQDPEGVEEPRRTFPAR